MEIDLLEVARCIILIGSITLNGALLWYLKKVIDDYEDLVKSFTECVQSYYDHVKETQKLLGSKTPTPPEGPSVPLGEDYVENTSPP